MNITEQEFSQLVRQNKSTIYTVCYMFSKDQDEVADLFQEVLIKLWNGISSFDGKSNVKTWIYRTRRLAPLLALLPRMFQYACIAYASS